MEIKRPSMILIMDGFGMNDDSYGNAIAQAEKPKLDAIFSKYPGTRINACGHYVGLPDGQMGNSEVGHMNIGAGRIVYQSLSRISMAIDDGSFFSNEALISAMEHCLKNGSALHISGLLSDGGVHSHIDHLLALIDMAVKKGISKIYIHCYLDGRDVPPRCAKEYIKKLEAHIAGGPVSIATISGRYYAMDRDKRWDRIKLAYDAITLGKGETAETAMEAVDNAYARDENDEFVKPTVIKGSGEPACLNDGDSMIMFNFRPDRAREITRALVDDAFDGFEREKKVSDLEYICMTEYDATMPNVKVAYPPEVIENTLGEYISGLGLKQLRIAETEKYAHVTFFFNGGIEKPYPGEDRILVPSPKVATYDLKPEMSAYEVTEKVLAEIEKDKYDLIVLNFANPDMVGHTGVMEAAVKAIETMEACVPRIADAILAKGGQILLTADHGNSDVMLDKEGNVVTSHSLNQVPLIHISDAPKKLKSGGKLADIAPTMLDLMGLPVPDEMTGDVLTLD